MAAVAAADPGLAHDTLIREAVSLGYRKEELERTPTYVIASMVAERKKKKKKHDKKKDRDASPPKTGAEDVHVYAEQLADLGQTVERLNELKLTAPAAGEVAEDDTRTVVNMDFITSTENPSDQKYKRFSFLVAAKNDLIKAIKTNTGLLQSVVKELDEDDVLVMRHDIQQAQYQLDLVNKEMREIHQWFAEVHQQKQVFYQQFLQRSADLTGNLSTHFQRKMENIQKYMQAMVEQTQLQVNDVK